ncbi:MAG: hypothetical protein WB761_32180, partial [Solirubrobacteraceae bacterium]
MAIYSLRGASTERTSRHTFHPVDHADARARMQRKPKQAAGEHSDPRDGRLPCQLHLDLVASVKLLTELTTL